MAIEDDRLPKPDQSYVYLWGSIAALLVLAATVMIGGDKKPSETAMAYDDTPDGLSGLLHQAMDHVMSIQAESEGQPTRSSTGDTLIFNRMISGSLDSMQKVLVYVDNSRGGLWARYDHGHRDLLASTVDRMKIRSDHSGNGETIILELSATLPTADGSGPRRNLHKIMSTEDNG